MAKEKPASIRVAVIGLIGTLLTVCGGVSGALVTNAAAIYSLEVEQRQVDLQPATGGQTLAVDTGEVFITRAEAAALDPAQYYVDLEHAFVTLRPASGWEALETLTVGEQLAEGDAACLAFCEAPVFRIRHGQPLLVTSDRATTINGRPIPADILDASEALYGLPPWENPAYDQWILNIFTRESLDAVGIRSLPDLLVFMTGDSLDRLHTLVAPQDASFAIVQLTSTYENILIDGQASPLTVDSWMYFAETPDSFYMIEITYLAGGGGSIQVWDDLQAYIDQFRIIQDRTESP